MSTSTSTTSVRRAGAQAVDDVAARFEAAGWRVAREPAIGAMRADLLVRKAARKYVVEVKAASEARPDRVVALLSQAILQAQAYAREQPGAKPLAVVRVIDDSASLFEKIRRFQHQYASDTAVGLISADGASYFIGAGLDDLNSLSTAPRRGSKAQRRHAHGLFSDLNQWMLKVLLAPEIPGRLLTAPRNDYRNASELAAAANVSVMSAFRLVTRLKEEHYLDESSRHLSLVRRADFFRRWQAATATSTPEIPMRLVAPDKKPAALRGLLAHRPACLGYFAAADALGFGHVLGVLPHVYVRRLKDVKATIWTDLADPTPTEPAQVIIKQTGTPESLFRGAVVADDVHIADVLQVWLDVSSHPARGAEQAALLQSKVLRDVIGSPV